jgi:hypothetical protein
LWHCRGTAKTACPGTDQDNRAATTIIDEWTYKQPAMALKGSLKQVKKLMQGQERFILPVLVTALVFGGARPACSQLNGAAPQALAETTDAMFKEPYIDVDEWRDKPVRHRYVHGGFKGTYARFSFYFPPKEQYQGRFFQHNTPAPSSENLEQQSVGEEDKIGFSIASGAYFIETNEGGPGATGAVAGYLVNAAAARYSRTVAAQMYGPHRTYGYAYGGSGGGFKTISGFENSDAWDGVVPYVIGSPEAIPNVFTVRMLALQVLHDKFPSILDAVEPGGSGDMYDGLNEEEKSALQEVTRMGFPPRAWFNYKTIGEGAFPVLFPIVRMLDPTYFSHDFWSVPGYLGANPPAYLQRARVQLKTRITKVLTVENPETSKALGGVDTAWKQMQAEAPVAFEVERVPEGKIEGAYLYFKSGGAAGKDLAIGKIVGKTVAIGINPFAATDTATLKAIKAGDEVQIDNSDFLAAQTYHRHQVPTPDFYVWDQFRGPDGKPLYPQRPKLIGPMITYGGAGSLQSGKFKGKMIVVESLMDQDAFPWQADWYRTKVKENLGSHLDDNFRLWFTDRAIHGDQEKQEDPTQTVSYLGILQQALRDLSQWVEKGVPPPPSTSYKVVDGQIVVPATAAERHGIQAVVSLTANGGTRAEVPVGKRVKFSASVELPPNTGKVVAAEWDFEGQGTFPVVEQMSKIKSSGSGSRITLTTTYSFSTPGTYFPTIRATSQRQGDPHTPYGRVHNLGRVRVVVQ